MNKKTQPRDEAEYGKNDKGVGGGGGKIKSGRQKERVVKDDKKRETRGRQMTGEGEKALEEPLRPLSRLADQAHGGE